MQFKQNFKVKTFALFIATLMITSIALITSPPATAATYTNIQDGHGIPLPAGVTPDVTVITSLGLAISPNPIGVNQQILVNMWDNPPITNARFFTGYTVTFTKPDGTTETKGPYTSYQGDSTAWFQYTVDQVGNWSAVFNFPGNYFPSGNYTSGQLAGFSSYGQVFSMPSSCYYTPSSSQKVTFTVQQDQVNSWPPTPLPTDYWTRPVTTMNREWWPILGNYPDPYMNNYEYAGPYTLGPTSCHILWTRQDAVGGLMGGYMGQLDTTASGRTPSVIYAGRCYDTISKPYNESQTQQVSAECYDLRTGQVYYNIPISQGGITPNAISYNRLNLPAVAGDQSDLGPVARLLNIGTRLIWIDPWSGQVIVNVTGMAGTFYNDPYVLSIQDLGASAGANRYHLINWTSEDMVKPNSMFPSSSIGNNNNFTSRIISNITFPFASLGTCDFNAAVSVTAQALPGAAADATGIQMGTRLIGVSLITGQVLWNVTTTYVNYSGSCAVADQGKYCFPDRDDTSGMLVAWDLNTGQQAWVSQKMQYPWGFGGAYAVASAYGLVYRYSYAGVYAFNWTNGQIVWRYATPCAPFESPWYPNMAYDSGGVIANGILYVGNSEHTPSQPIARGWELSAINATSGQGIWNITGGFSVGPVADGYLTAGNSYDASMYVFGKGLSTTTVSAPQTQIATGTNAIISGTILDQSPGQPGTPCVSDDSMNTYMEYLHAQEPIDGLYHNVTVTGVPVSIDAIDPNGNNIHIGDTASDVSGTFSYTWTPTIAGNYKITATFAGTNSYGSSSAETHANVANAQTATTTTSTAAPLDIATTTDIMMYIVAVGIAIIIAIAIVGIVLYRKHA
jgi:hypothetical protein